MNGLTNYRWVFFIVVVSVLVASQACQQQSGQDTDRRDRPTGGYLSAGPTLSADKELGSGALLNIKIDRFSVPYTNLMVMTQKLAASGIPVHSHRWEDEVIYVIQGRGFAVVNEAQTAVPIETGSVLYIPIGTWHGLRNADPNDPMDALLVTTPVKPDGLGDYFRFASVEPGHPPLNLPEEEFLKLVKKYGMDVPAQK